LIHKKFEAVQKDRSYFSQTAPSLERHRCPKQYFMSTICVSKVYTKAVVPNPFVTAAGQCLVVSGEHSRNTVSMEKIDQSHAQKVMSPPVKIL